MKQSFTLTEILVGTVLLVTIFAVLMGSFVSLREYVNRADARLEAANEARIVLNNLYGRVTAQNWSPAGPASGEFVTGAYTGVNIGGVTCDYTVSVPAGLAQSRQIDLSITYNP